MPKRSLPPLIRLFIYARRHRTDILLASLFSVLNKIFDLAPPALIGAAVDIVVARENSVLARLGVVEINQQLWLLGITTFVIWGLESLFEYLFAVRWRTLAQAIEHDLRMDAYAHVQDLEMAYFEDRSTGGLMSILNNDVNQLERFLDSGANDMLQLLTTVIVIGGMFFLPGSQRRLDVDAADALYFVGLDLLPAPAGAALFGCPGKSGAAQRAACQ